ncbi:MATE family efflux transporter [Clostridiales bacterium BX7]|uniref:Multidrug export protein MepA n=2 Tax=Feifania hominis TaxID=2763660 RepID=A0A926DDZ4_9FIRM|nr:MATE family efflux transporter [Feifania hominis]
MPAIFAQLINALYNVVDRMYISRLPDIGQTALTGVGVTFPIIMLISAFSALVGMGGAPRAAIAMGEGNNDKAEKILGNCVTVLLSLSVLLTVFFLVFERPLLMMFGASEDTVVYATQYITIYLVGTVFVQIALGLNSFINTQGYAKTGMLTILIGACLNIVLDPIFMFALDMGVQGAALATILSQAVSAAWVLQFLFGKRSKLRIRAANLRLKKEYILPVLALGMAPFVMQATESLLNIVLNANLQAQGGDEAVGAMTIIASIMQFALMPVMGLTQGAQPIISYNYGAKQYHRCKRAFWLLLASSFSMAVVIWGSVMLFPQVFIGIFSDKAPVIAYTTWAIRIFMSAYFLMGAQIACQQTFMAVGRAKISLFLALLRKVVLLIPLVMILARPFGVTGIFTAEPIADTLATLTTCTVFAFSYKKMFPAAEPAQ